jgi:predicted Zn-dependent protease with MMP-like domain
MASAPARPGSSYSVPPSLEDIVVLAEAALAAMPKPLRDLVQGVAILVEETPDDETLAELGLDNAWELTGLDRGVPLTQKSVLDAPQEPDTVLLFREPILLEWIETGEDLPRLVSNVLVHEIGHHFGLSDADIERLEND